MFKYIYLAGLLICLRVVSYLSVIDVADCANVDMGLCSLKYGVCAVHVHELCGVLLLEGALQRARVAILETVSGGPQERRN